MSKTKFYRQCRLIQKTEEGEKVLLTWIPESYKDQDISEGTILVLKEVRGTSPLSGQWVVDTVGENPLPEAIVKDKAHVWTTYRGNTDI